MRRLFPTVRYLHHLTFYLLITAIKGLQDFRTIAKMDAWKKTRKNLPPPPQLVIAGGDDTNPSRVRVAIGKYFVNLWGE